MGCAGRSGAARCRLDERGAHHDRTRENRREPQTATATAPGGGGRRRARPHRTADPRRRGRRGATGTTGAAGAAGAATALSAAVYRPIVFARYDAAAPVEDLYAMSPTGGALVRLTHTPDVSDVMPSWSPDGKRVAFLRYGAGGAINGIWTMNSKGGDLKSVPGTTDASDPAWSPDGKRIAYSRPVDGQREIYVADVDGTPATRLTHSPEDEFHPTWSPDGENLAFSRADAAGHSRLLRIQVSTLVQTPITLSFSQDWTPDWSRGNRIVFSRADGTGFTHLTPSAPTARGPPLTSGQANDKFPPGRRTAGSWSSPGAAPTTPTPSTSSG
ncbi:hypothetical protein O1L60_08830 [Streptomyces diastatochromogenes]|nr:hypothetical protein [Streptomyces diastatochromogenes]